MINEIMKLVNSKGKIKEWTTTNNSKVEIINLLSILCTNKEIFFDRKDNMLYSQFTTFERKISRNGGSSIQYAAREGFKDDKIMSLAIAVMSMSSVYAAEAQGPISRWLDNLTGTVAQKEQFTAQPT